MIVSQEKPVCWDRLEKEFGVKWVPGLYVTYDAQIHSPSGEIETEYLVHELVHVAQQQGKDPEAHLEKYIADPKYRLSCELPAYKVQVAFLRATIENPDELFVRMHKIWKAMANSYKGMVTYEEAKQFLS